MFYNLRVYSKSLDRCRPRFGQNHRHKKLNCMHSFSHVLPLRPVPRFWVSKNQHISFKLLAFRLQGIIKPSGLRFRSNLGKKKDNNRDFWAQMPFFLLFALQRSGFLLINYTPISRDLLGLERRTTITKEVQFHLKGKRIKNK